MVGGWVVFLSTTYQKGVVFMFRNKKKEKQKIETPREIAIKMMIDGVSSEKISLYSGIPIGELHTT